MYNFKGKMRPAQGVYLARHLSGEGIRISTIARRLRVARSTVQRWLSPETDPTEPLQRRMGAAKRNKVARRRKLIKKLALQSTKKTAWRGVHGNRDPIIVVRRDFPSCLTIARELFVSSGIVASASTVRRDLREMGFCARVKPSGPRRREADEDKRLAFASRWSRQANANDILFSDEKICDVNDHGGRWEWNPRGVHPSTMERDRFAAKVMCWGLIGVGVKKLIFLDENVDHKVYIKQCLRPNLATLQNKHFVQDNARAHISSHTLQYLQRNKVKVVDWPPRSPDINPIETMWAWMQAQVDRRGPTSTDEVKKFWLEQWDSIPQSSIDDLVSEFPLRCKAVEKHKGKTLPGNWRQLLK